MPRKYKKNTETYFEHLILSYINMSKISSFQTFGNHRTTIFENYFSVLFFVLTWWSKTIGFFQGVPKKTEFYHGGILMNLEIQQNSSEGIPSTPQHALFGRKACACYSTCSPSPPPSPLPHGMSGFPNVLRMFWPR